MLLNADTISGRESLVKQIDFNILCYLTLWSKMLSLIDRVNNSLQAKSLTLDSTAKMLNGRIISIQNLRENEIMKIAKEMAVRLGVNAEFSEKRRRKIKRHDTEKAPDKSYFFHRLTGLHH